MKTKTKNKVAGQMSVSGFYTVNNKTVDSPDCDMCFGTFEEMKACGGYEGCLEKRKVMSKEDFFIKDASRERKNAILSVEEQIASGENSGNDPAASVDCDGYKQQNEIASSEQAAAAVSEFGKFKNPHELLRAYNALEAEFTKRCQRIKELILETHKLKKAQAAIEKTESENVIRIANHPAEPDLNAEQTAGVAKGREQKLATGGLNQPVTEGIREECAEQAAGVARGQFVEKTGNRGCNYSGPDSFSQTRGNTEQEFLRCMEDDDFLDTVIIGNPKVRAKIIEGYLRALDGCGATKVLSGGRGRTTLQPAARPKTLEEAKKLAELLIG